MKIILSRKGFDTGSGGCPSPIFPDGSMLALPIPDKQSSIRYQDLTWNRRNLGDLVATLSKGRQRADYRAHLDPDLIPGMRPRKPGWRPVFGQTGAAQSHLVNQGVGPGDLFLYFGLFREVDDQGRFTRHSQPRHILWGWLQVGEVLVVDDHREQLGWAEGHPHLNIVGDRRNVMYVAGDYLNMPGSSDLPGTGVWPHFDPKRQLTAPGAKCSRWVLPAWFHPKGRKSSLSFHGKASAWTACDDGVLMQSVGRGQEFVLDAEDYPEATSWALGLVLSDPVWSWSTFHGKGSRPAGPASLASQESRPHGTNHL